MNTSTNKLHEEYKDNEIEISQLFSSLLRYRFPISIITSVAILFSFIYAERKKPIWQGQFQIVLRDNDSKQGAIANLDSSILSQFNMSTGQKDRKTEVKILQSPSVLLPVYEFVKNEKVKLGRDVSALSYRLWITQLGISLADGTAVLEIKYRDQNKSIIMPVLNKISSTYQTYSGRDRSRGLAQGISYLKKQLVDTREKSNASFKKLQAFSIKHRLGNLDGIPMASNSTSTDAPENRYMSHFNTLEMLEAELVEKSARLKPNSRRIKSLKVSINALKESLVRPKEVLLDYRQLKRDALREESLLRKIENQLSSLQLEKIRQTRPWELISTPTVLDRPVAPNKKQMIIIGSFFGFIISSLFSLIWERRSGIIYDLKAIQYQLPYPFLKTFQIRSKENWSDSVKLMVKGPLFVKPNESIALVHFGTNFISEYKTLSKLFSNSLKSSEIILTDKLLESINCTKILLIIAPGSITQDGLNLLNEELKMLNINVSGWISIEPN